jgi:hypothetical protein
VKNEPVNVSMEMTNSEQTERPLDQEGGRVEPKRESSSSQKQPRSFTPGDNLTGLFQSDPLFVENFFNDRRNQTLIPEKRLMLAVLEDALWCFQENLRARDGKRKQLFDNVVSWFFETNGDRVFDFRNICNSLGFDADYLRKGLLQWRERQLSKYYRVPKRAAVAIQQPTLA